MKKINSVLLVIVLTSLCAFAQDTYYSDQWYLKNTGNGQYILAGTDINVENAWYITTGDATITVAVLDGGVEQHEDFYSGQILSGWTAGGGNGAPDTTIPANIHGQAVAGIIGAVHDNNKGIKGVAPKVKILPVNIGHISNDPQLVADAINWAWQNGADIINLSAEIPIDVELEYKVINAINNARTYGRGGKGTVFVKSAGNTQVISFPGGVPGVLTVSRVRSNNTPFSDTPLDPTYAAIDVVAPSGEPGSGSNGNFGTITTLAWMGTPINLPGNLEITSDGKYMENFSGSSAAAPQVSGIAALMLSVNPNLTESQVRDIIRNTTGYDYGTTQWAGEGRVDAYAAVLEALPKQNSNVTSYKYTTGFVHIQNDITVTGTWDFGPGTTVLLDDNVDITVNPGGRILANGYPGSPVTFKRADPDKDWGQIELKSSTGSSFSQALIDGGYRNLYIRSRNNYINNSTIRNGTYTNIYTSTNNDGTETQSQVTIYNTLIQNSGSYGIRAFYSDLDISYTTIIGSYRTGLYIYASDVYPFHHNLIISNANPTGYDGVKVNSTGSFYMHNSNYGKGYNELYGNGDDQVESSGDFIAGSIYPGSGGYNKFYDYYYSGEYLIDNNSSTPVKSYYNYYGVGPINTNTFQGTVYSSNALGFDPTYGVAHGANSSVPTKILPEEGKVEPEEIVSNYNRLESEFKSSGSTEESRENLYSMYLTVDLSGEKELKKRFRNFISELSDGNRSLSGSKADNSAVTSFSKLLYVKSLFREGQFGEANQVLKSMEMKEFTKLDRKDVLEHKLASEIFLEEYETAWNTLVELYAYFEQVENKEEEKLGYVSIEEELRQFVQKPEVQFEEIQEEELAIRLYDSYPNPFNPTTNIRYSIPQQSAVLIKVYDLLGRQVAELVNETKQAGEYTVSFDASGLATGIYIYKLVTDGNILTKKMTLLK